MMFVSFLSIGVIWLGSLKVQLAELEVQSSIVPFSILLCISLEGLGSHETINT